MAIVYAHFSDTMGKLCSVQNDLIVCQRGELIEDKKRFVMKAGVPCCL